MPKIKSSISFANYRNFLKESLALRSSQPKETFNSLAAKNHISLNVPNLMVRLGLLTENGVPGLFKYQPKSEIDKDIKSIKNLISHMNKKTRNKEKKILHRVLKNKSIQPSIEFQNEDYPPQHRTLSVSTDADLVSELRRRGYEVKATKIMEL